MKRNQTLSMILMLTAASGMALAAPETKESDNKDLLRGPAVVDSTTTKKDANDPMKQDQAADQSPPAMREITLAIRNLSSERSGNTLNLTPEQQAQIKVIMDQFRTDMQAFQQANKVTIRELRDQANKDAREMKEKMRAQREADAEKGEEDGAQKQRPQLEPSPAAKKLREMIENSPASKTAIASIKKALSPEQFQLVEQSVFELRNRTTAGDRAPRTQRDGQDGMERETPRRQIDGERVRPEQRRQRDQKNKTDKPIDD